MNPATMNRHPEAHSNRVRTIDQHYVIMTNWWRHDSTTAYYEPISHPRRRVFRILQEPSDDGVSCKLPTIVCELYARSRSWLNYESDGVIGRYP